MANDSTKVDDEEITEEEEVETEESEDETDDSEAESEDEDNEETDAEESDEEDEEDSEEDDAEDESEDKFDKRFTQLKGDTPDEYRKSLEDAYANSSTEGQRLSAKVKELEQKMEQLAKQDPELADKFEEETGQPLDPVLQTLKQEVEERQLREYNEFAEKHPEVATDTELQTDLNDALAIVANHHYKKTGKLLGMKDGLDKAWKLIGKSDEEEVDMDRAKAKNAAAQGRPAGSSKKTKSDSDDLAPSVKEVARKMGADPKLVAKYAKKTE